MLHPLYCDINTALLHARPARLTFVIDTHVGSF
jgi:hypothetical protein